MKAQQKFAKASRDATYKRKLQCHAQAASSSAAAAASTTPEQQKMLRLSKSLSSVMREHLSGGGEASKSSALALINSFPPLSAANDKKFIAGQRLVKCLAHFRVPSSSDASRNVSQHFVSHCYLLDAPALLTFVLHLQAVSAKPKEDLAVLAPRIAELSPDFLPLEALAVLSVMNGARVPHAACTERLFAQIVQYGDGLSTEKLCDALKLASQQGHTNVAALLLPKVEDAIPSMSRQALRSLATGLVKVTVPRRIMNAVARRTMAFEDLSPSELAAIAHLFHMQSYRHERFLSHVAQRQARQVDLQTGNSLALMLSALAHFYANDGTVPILLKRAQEVQLSGAQVASICYAVARLKGDVGAVRALVRKMKDGGRASPATLANVLWAMLTLKMQTAADVEAIKWLADGLAVALKEGPHAGARSTLGKCALLVGRETPKDISNAVGALL